MTIHAIVGGQFGSEAKGHVAAEITQHYVDKGISNLLVRIGGSNAGHSAVDADGRTWALRQIPAAAVIDRNAPLILAQGSEIDVDVVMAELDALDAANYNASARLYIDPSATIVEQRHHDLEAGSDLSKRTGSTNKGIGAARADRLMRKAMTARDCQPLERWLTNTAKMIKREHTENDVNVIIEGTQGYGLGLHTDNYPQTTSGDCRTVDLLAQIGYAPLNPDANREVHTWLVCRTYPIRVAGNSGALLDELEWSQLTEQSGGYIQPELTTVTRKTRRIGGWDARLVRAAIEANGGTGRHLHPCLMFIDYLDPILAGARYIETLHARKTTDAAIRIAEMIADIGQPFDLFGTSPSTAMFDHAALTSTISNW